MTIKIEKGEAKERELVPTGNHVARLYSIVEIGHLPDVFNEGKMVHKLRLTFELPEEMREFDGVQKPMVIGGKYTISLYEKSNLRPIVEGMLGSLSDDEAEDFDFKTLLGKACMVQVVHQTSQSGKQYAKILSVTQLPKSMKAPAQFNPSQYLDYHEGWNEEVYKALPQFVKDDMSESDEMKKRNDREMNGYPKEDINPEDIPF